MKGKKNKKLSKKIVETKIKTIIPKILFLGQDFEDITFKSQIFQQRKKIKIRTY